MSDDRNLIRARTFLENAQRDLADAYMEIRMYHEHCPAGVGLSAVRAIETSVFEMWQACDKWQTATHEVEEYFKAQPSQP